MCLVLKIVLYCFILNFLYLTLHFIRPMSKYRVIKKFMEGNQSLIQSDSYSSIYLLIRKDLPVLHHRTVTFTTLTNRLFGDLVSIHIQRLSTYICHYVLLMPSLVCVCKTFFRFCPLKVPP